MDVESMLFCPECKSVLVPSKVENKIVHKCHKCGYESRKEKKIVSRIKQRQEKVVVIDFQKQEFKTMPTAYKECSKCGNRKATYWMVQTRSGDEGMTQFFRCTICHHTWREMS